MASRSIKLQAQGGIQSITAINCGTSSPRLGGSVDLSAFTNLTSFTCTSNDITALSGYSNKSNLSILSVADNKITGELPSLSALTNLTYFACNSQLTGLTELTGFTGSIPSLTGLTQLDTFLCHENQLDVDGIPSLAGLTALRYFFCYGNKLSGAIPDLSDNTKLVSFHVSNNQFNDNIPLLTGLINLNRFLVHDNNLEGSIPSLTGLVQLQNFQCQNNALDGFAGGSVSNTLGDFQAQNNQLPASAVNAILAAFVAAGRVKTDDNTCLITIGGTGNAAPTGQGITDKNTLISRGWSITTN